MTRPVQPFESALRRARRYGVDAPSVPIGLLVAALACFVGASSRSSRTRARLSRPLKAVGASLLLQAACYLHTTWRGKFLFWEQQLDCLELSGDEHILDIGCGRGAVLLMAARRLSTGRAVGVDLWRTRDQSGNSEAATWRNAVAEGVTERIQLQTGDMTELALPDESFEIVVSSLAIHNIPTTAGRVKAIDEAVRVLRPNGRLVIADIRASDLYRARLLASGMASVSTVGLGWRGWWGSPWVPTVRVTATKPADTPRAALSGAVSAVRGS